MNTFLTILTPTYNRAKNLPIAYKSIEANLRFQKKIQWIIIDDGSEDNTKDVVKSFHESEYLEILYIFQENSGKMKALNNGMQYAKGDFTMDLDSDDIISPNAIKLIQENCFVSDIAYAFVFLKGLIHNGDIHGHKFSHPNESTTFLELQAYGDKEAERCFVFVTNIRKKYFHRLEENEKFVIEGRMYHEMDKKYCVFPINEVMQYFEYLEDGYTKNFKNLVVNNPKGFYEHFKQILSFDLSKVPMKYKMYAIKHYILYTYLSGRDFDLTEVKSIKDKFLLLLLYYPGIYMAKKKGYKRKLDESN